MLFCPACAGVSMEAWIDPQTALEIDCCPSCHGFWFDGEELGKLFPSSVLARRAFGLEALAPTPGFNAAERSCPRCAQVMKRTRALEVEVDVCRRCRGIWLDAGELLLLSRRYRDQRSGDLMVLNQLALGLAGGNAQQATAMQALLWMLEHS